jgi:hypothetical protein
MISDPGLTLTLYAAEPGSSTAHALDLLASWQATELAETAAAETAIIARPGSTPRISDGRAAPPARRASPNPRRPRP